MNFAETNLTTLPDNLQQYWPSVYNVYLDLAQFERFPATLTQMPSLLALSLVSNNVSSLSKADASDLFTNNHLQWLTLSNSSLESFPEEFEGDLDQLYWLQVEYTQLRKIPEKIRQWFLRKLINKEYVHHSLYGSPYCSITIAEDQRIYQEQMCGLDQGTAAIPLYVELTIPQRPL